MKAKQLWFTGPHQVEIREQELPDPGATQILVESSCSAISAGTEMLAYRGQIPEGMELDTNLDSLKGDGSYPLQYGYACVGKVIQAGNEVAATWKGKRVFAFQPHASHFIAEPQQVITIPEDVDDDAAAFLANMETAVSLAQDGKPGLGERVVILGLGVVGQLLSGVLSRFPLDQLHALDGMEERRDHAHQLAIIRTHDPVSDKNVASLKQDLRSHQPAGADLVFEVSGIPDALNLAVDLCGFAGRIIIGSWYGSKSAPVNLGGEAHRNRIRLQTSQVSTIAPELSGRWNKTRRYETAWDQIRQIKPQSLISHRIPIKEAAEIYKQLDLTPEKVMQAIFTYD